MKNFSACDNCPSRKLRMNFLFFLLLKFIYSEKAKRFKQISLFVLMVLLSNVKTEREISSNFVVFSEYINFKIRMFIQKGFQPILHHDLNFLSFQILLLNAIFSFTGTIRGVKNRVRAGIATFLRDPSFKVTKKK